MEGVSPRSNTTRASLRMTSKTLSSKYKSLPQTSKRTSRLNLKASKDMDNFIDRVTSWRIFKQIAEYACGRRGATSKLLLISRDSSTVEDSEEELSSDFYSTEIPRFTHYSDPALGPAELESYLKFEHSPVKENEANHINLPKPLPHISAVSCINTATKPPLTAIYPEVFTFVGKESEVCTGVSLTRMMVWQFNTIFQGERKMAEYISQINSTASQLATIEGNIAEISSQVDELAEAYKDHSGLPLAMIREQKELERLLQLREGLNLEILSLKKNVEQVQEDIHYAKNHLFSDWKETLAEGGLLEPLGEDAGVQIPASQNVAAYDREAQSKPKTPTASEIKRYEEEDAREIALNYVAQKQLQLQEAQTRFDNLQDYYVEEYHTYLACVEEGRISASKSKFDRMMLLDARETTRNLIQAEVELEQARNQARELGLTPNWADQESCFVDFPDDGYRESLEAQFVTHVDRDWIEKWMEHEYETLGETECDEWDSRTVDISDSVSAVANSFKARKRIDQWRSACVLLDVEMNTDTGL